MTGELGAVLSPNPTRIGIGRVETRGGPARWGRYVCPDLMRVSSFSSGGATPLAADHAPGLHTPPILGQDSLEYSEVRDGEPKQRGSEAESSDPRRTLNTSVASKKNSGSQS